MKIFFFSLLIICCIFSNNVVAQQTINKIENDNLFSKFSCTNCNNNLSNAHTIIILHDAKIPDSINVLRTINENIAIVKIGYNQKIHSIASILKSAPSNNLWKFSPSLEKKVFTINNDLMKFIVVGDDIENILKSFRNNFTSNNYLNKNECIIKCSGKFLLENIVTLPEVNFIDEYVEPKSEVGIIGYDRSFHGINSLDYLLPNANGKNIVVGVKEQKMEVADLDIYKRILPSTLAASTVDNHATVISSIIGGAGNSFYNGRGMANACKFFSSSFSNLFPDDINILNMSNVTVQNHSYGTIPQQFYGAEARRYDEQLWSDKNILHIFSAGNRGLQFATEGSYSGLANFANITGNFKMAKNIITVAGVNEAGVVANESSAGPLYDGRLAPQITALGPNGTSDAAAMVSGTIAVMQQVYKDSNSQQLPPASLLKALLYNTTEDINKIGIDYKTGYGLLNSYEAVRALQQKKYDGSTISQGQQWIKNIIVPANAANIKITLTWTDSASQLNNNKALTNDLDLQVQEISSGIVYKPWVLSSIANIDSLNKIAVRKRDSLNTSEQVSIVLPTAGQYQIKVLGYSMVNVSLPFSIAYNVDTLNTFSFTNPQNTTDVNIQEQEFLKIKWKTFVADTNQVGNLSISYNGGNNWEVIKQNFKIYKREFPWKIKDTSTIAVIKMETSFGTFLSKNFIVSRVIRPQVDFLCADSFRISWNKHAYATSYKIYTLIDSAYLKPIMSITDTFKVFKKIDFPTTVYAIEPILGNGYSAARSISFDINDQGVSCFYKSFNYNLLENNEAELTLEIEITEYLDSIYFDEVDVQGNLLQTYTGVKVQNGKYIYNTIAKNLASGITYFRARIKLKSEAVVYTSIISVLTSGEKKILFYPNPIIGNGVIKYVLQQGTFSNNSIQFFDASGRYLKGYTTIPDAIDISKFPTGLIIYKLLNEKAVVIETGKIIVVR